MSTIKFIIPKSMVLLSMALLSSAVMAADAVHIGNASLVINDVFTSTSTGEVRVKANDALFFKQQILTKEKSTLTVTFRDDSTFSVSPQSVVLLDEFVFNPSENVLEKSINILKGSFRYISGFPIKGSNTKVVTPFGTAGIRGSAVQGVVSPKTGLTMNVASGMVVFQGKDGKTSTINEGETLSVSAQCDTLPPVPAGAVADSMEYLANTFTQGSDAPLSSQQLLANAEANNMPVAAQKQAYIATQQTPLKPQNLQGTDVIPSSKLKLDADVQLIIDRLLQELKNKNINQVDSATQNIITATVASGLTTEKITQVSMNAVLGAKDDQKVHVAAMILNTLQALKPELAAEIAPKVQQILPTDQQSKLPDLMPNVVFPLSAPNNKTKILIH